MLLSRWFFINIIVVGLFLWKLTTTSIHLPIIFGALGFILFMFNWLRHAMFATLRSDIPRKRKIRFAKISKWAMPIHRWTGTIALICIIIHASTIFYQFGFQTTNYKMMFGFMAGIMMSIVVISGWIRHMRTTAFKRVIHLSVAFTLFYLIIIHLSLF